MAWLLLGVALSVSRPRTSLWAGHSSCPPCLSVLAEITSECRRGSSASCALGQSASKSVGDSGIGGNMGERLLQLLDVVAECGMYV